jgi:hypothetical protein
VSSDVDRADGLLLTEVVDSRTMVPPAVDASPEIPFLPNGELLASGVWTQDTVGCSDRHVVELAITPSSTAFSDSMSLSDGVPAPSVVGTFRYGVL